jgi:hypothetical protein
MNIDYKPFLQTVEENTDNNNHTENCVLIAYNFGSKFQYEQAIEIRKDHEQKQSIDYFVSMARDYLTKDVLNNMSNKKLARAINKRL